MPSGLQSITYGTVVNAVKNYIKNNCVNITNFGGIPAEFKSGYSTTVTLGGGNGTATCYCTISISGGNVVQKTTSDVDTDMTNYLSSIGASNILNNEIKDSELLKFVNDMVIFCTTKVAFATSVHNGNRYMIYSNSTSYDSKENVSAGYSDKQIDYTDATSVINAVVTITERVMREIPCTYSYNYS